MFARFKNAGQKPRMLRTGAHQTNGTVNIRSDPICAINSVSISHENLSKLGPGNPSVEQSPDLTGTHKYSHMNSCTK